jgi:citrate synthase
MIKKQLEIFKQTLQKQRLVPFNTVTYHVEWVRRYLTFCEGIPAASTGIAVERFLYHMGAQRKYRDWQIEQMKNAIHLFKTHCGNPSRQAAVETVCSTKADIDASIQALDELN